VIERYGKSLRRAVRGLKRQWTKRRKMRLSRLENLEPRLLMSVTPLEQHLIYTINRMRGDPGEIAAFSETNGPSIASRSAKPPLAVNATISSTADQLAAAMGRGQREAGWLPIWPNGLLRRNGYPLPAEWPSAANGIETTLVGTDVDSAARVVTELFAGDAGGTRITSRQLLGTDASFASDREIGVGYFSLGGDGSAPDRALRDHWSINVAHRSSPAVFLTGVAFEDKNGDAKYDPGEGIAGVAIRVGDAEVLTNDAGGWSLAVAPGTHVVTADGPGFDRPSFASVVVGSDNIEIDFLAGRVRGDVAFTIGRNTLSASDVNADGRLASTDVLALLRLLGAHGAGPASRFYADGLLDGLYPDVYPDGRITVSDLLAAVRGVKAGDADAPIPEPASTSIPMHVALRVGSEISGPEREGPSPRTVVSPAELVNTFLPRLQSTREQAAAIATGPTGESMIVFAGRGLDDLDGIYARRYSADGSPLGDAFRVNTTVRESQHAPTVAVDGSGNYLVAWSGRGTGDQHGIFAQWLAPDGSRVGGEVLVNTTIGGIQDQPSVAMAADGRAFVAWSGTGARDFDGIFLRRFSSDRSPIGDELLVNDGTRFEQAYPSIAATPDGSLVATWSSRHQDGSDWGIYGRRYAADGSPVGIEFAVNESTLASQLRSSTAVDARGRFVVVWSSVDADAGSSSIWGRRFESEETAIGTEWRITDSVGARNKDARAAMSREGQFLVTWTTGRADGSGWEVAGRYYDPGRIDAFDVFLANSVLFGPASGHQQFSAVALGPGPSARIAWSGRGPADRDGVYWSQVTSSGSSANQAPILDAIDDRNVQPGDVVAFIASASDPDGPSSALRFSLDEGSPEGASIDPITGAFDWAPESVGAFPVTVRVTDGGEPALSDTATFLVVVTPACDSDAEWSGWETGGSESGRGTTDVDACGVQLIEGDSFEVGAEAGLAVPDGATAIEFTIDGLAFDGASEGRMRDALEVALVDGAGSPRVHTLRRGRDGFVNFSDGLPAESAAGVTIDGNRVRVNIAGLANAEELALRFRLINNDGDTESRVGVSRLAFIVDPSITPVTTIPPASGESVSGLLDLGGLSDVTASVAARYFRTSFDEASRILESQIALAHEGDYPLAAPLVLAVDQISDPSVRALGADGVLADGQPYFDFSDRIGAARFEPSTVTGNRTIAFHNPTGVPFTYDLVVLGQLNRPPRIHTEPRLEAIVGRPYAYDAAARDPDGDPIAFAMLSAPAGMEGMEGGAPSLRWTPGRADLGAHSVALLASDGRGGRTSNGSRCGSSMRRRTARPSSRASRSWTRMFLANTSTRRSPRTWMATRSHSRSRPDPPA